MHGQRYGVLTPLRWRIIALTIGVKRYRKTLD
jgi:hypothetical protein